MRAVPALIVAIGVLAAAPATFGAVPATRLVSRADGPAGRLAVTGGFAVDISQDGRYVLFGTRDPDLTRTHGVGGGDQFDYYVRDTEAGRTELVSRETGTDGAPIAACSPGGMSADARHVVLQCGARLLIRDRVAYTTTAVTAFPYQNYASRPTADGRYAIVRGADALGEVAAQVELATGAVEYHVRYSGEDGARAPSFSSPGVVSSNGRYTTFESSVQDLETPRATAPPAPPTGPNQIYVRDLETDRTILASRADGAIGSPATSTGAYGGLEISDDGRVIFSSDDSALVPAGRHALVRDVVTGHTEIVDRNSRGELADVPPRYFHIFPDGRHVIFDSHAGNLDGCVNRTYANIYIRDLTSGVTRLLNRNGNAQALGDTFMGWPSYSRDGRFVAYTTGSRELDPPNDSDWAQVYEVVDVLSVLGLPERESCSTSRPGGGAPTCLDRATLTTLRDRPLDLPPAPCSDPLGRALTIAVVSGPSHGTLAPPSANGHRLYTPAGGFVGRDVIRYQASNGSSTSNVAELDIDVTGKIQPADTTAPHVTWLSRLRLDKRGRARGRLRCDEPCVVTLRLTGRAGRKRVNGPVRAFTGTTVRVTLKLKRHNGRVNKLRASGSVRDAAGNARPLSSRVRPRPARR
jgi:hypothetical protein